MRFLKKSIVSFPTQRSWRTTLTRWRCIFWHGFGYIVSSSGTCSPFNPAGNRYNVRFQPRQVLQNGPNSRMGWFNDDYVMSLETNNAPFDNTPRVVKFASIWTGAYSTSFPVKVQFAGSPAIANNTVNFFANGTIQSFDAEQGCNVVFRLVLTRTNEN
jgi:hypothetical protein